MTLKRWLLDGVCASPLLMADFMAQRENLQRIQREAQAIIDRHNATKQAND